METYLAYSEVYKKTQRAYLRRTDFLRWSYVGDQIGSRGAILDVGVGAGQFVNLLSKVQPSFESITGLDLSPHSGFLDLSKSITMDYASVTDMPFKDGQFETVTCMEVIEHLGNQDMLVAIAELRRVTDSKLILTVPYCEKEPLPHFHKQRYTRRRLNKLFPNAEFTYFSSHKDMAWVMIEETY